MPRAKKSSTLTVNKNGGKVKSIAQSLTGILKNENPFSTLHEPIKQEEHDSDEASRSETSVKSSLSSEPSSTSTTQTSVDVNDVDDDGFLTPKVSIKPKRDSKKNRLHFIPIRAPANNDNRTTRIGRNNNTTRDVGKPTTRENTKRAASRLTAGPNEVRFISTKDLYPGVIIAIEYTTQCFDPNAANIDSSEGETYVDKWGQWWIRKVRYFTVLSVHAFHINVVAMYTYGKKGIINKPEDLQWEHVSVRGKFVRKRGFKSQSQHEPLEVTQLKDSNNDILPMAVVHFTKNHSITFDQKAALIGEVSRESVYALEELRRKAGISPISENKATAPAQAQQVHGGNKAATLARKREGAGNNAIVEHEDES